jgi:predicted peptidase
MCWINSGLFGLHKTESIMINTTGGFMKKARAYAIFCIGIIVCAATVVQSAAIDAFFVRRSQPGTGTGITIPYRLFIPKNYSASTRYPLVVTFHGSGACGNDNNAQIADYPGAELWAEDTSQAKNPCFVYAPQCPAQNNWVSGNSWAAGLSYLRAITPVMETVMATIDSLKREFSLDTNRFYVTGFSLGGGATWDVIERFPNMWAAAIPIAGAGDTTQAAAIAHIPVWDSHGSADPNVPVIGSRNMWTALSRVGSLPVLQYQINRNNLCNCPLDAISGFNSDRPGFEQAVDTAKHIYTEYGDAGHGVYVWTYAEPLLPAWLFSQSRQTPTGMQSHVAAAAPKNGISAGAIALHNGRIVLVGNSHRNNGLTNLYNVNGKRVDLLTATNKPGMIMQIKR